MSLLEKRLKSQTRQVTKPSWVSDKNVTYRVYDILLEIKKQKIQNIKNSKITELDTKKNYQISAGELARQTDVAKTTLISTSSYSAGLKQFLDEVNIELSQLRNYRISSYKDNQQSVKQRKKDQILEENKKLKSSYEELLRLNASEQVKIIIDNLSLPLRNRLGIK